MGTRTEYFCDLCENPRSLGQLTKFVLDGAAEPVLMRVIVGLGDKHICAKCLAEIIRTVNAAGDVPEQSPV